jgi:hypothetical protein
MAVFLFGAKIYSWGLQACAIHPCQVFDLMGSSAFLVVLVL